ncbi:MarR family winged helix-turn-helix transcriptional regulator [Tepidicaulis sp. LMO-SS28]|uniref:MarR family winged helix-turn-helix transcriptional regulator n=1 Tax=Tepidicaulis sp. LMO-SS28 TaxID=3447455 RepID=UPI003EE3C00C
MTGRNDVTEADVRASCACVRARMAARKLTRAYDKALKPVGLKITQFTLLIAISEGRAKSLSTLADFLALERTTLLRNLKLLEEAGLIESEPTGEGRALSLKLTKEGRKKLKAALPYWHDAQSKIEAGLGKDWPQVRGSLEELVRQA